ncbi:MAG: regulatory protein RecX [Acutalibacteraceae bacterium]
MLVTDVQIRKKSLCALYIDGEFAMELDAKTVQDKGIVSGVTITDEQLHELIELSGFNRAKSRAMYFLSLRDYSRKELIDKICADSDEHYAEMAADRMQELGLINDVSYAERFAHDCFYIKNYSIRRTEYELSQKGIDRDIICEIIEKISPDERELIDSLISRKYYRKLNDEKGMRQTVAALQRLGYRYEDIRAVIEQYSEE